MFDDFYLIAILDGKLNAIPFQSIKDAMSVISRQALFDENYILIYKKGIVSQAEINEAMK
jgi:hypothetical protein